MSNVPTVFPCLSNSTAVLKCPCPSGVRPTVKAPKKIGSNSRSALCGRSPSEKSPAQVATSDTDTTTRARPKDRPLVGQLLCSATDEDCAAAHAGPARAFVIPTLAWTTPTRSFRHSHAAHRPAGCGPSRAKDNTIVRHRQTAASQNARSLRPGFARPSACSTPKSAPLDSTKGSSRRAVGDVRDLNHRRNPRLRDRQIPRENIGHAQLTGDPDQRREPRHLHAQ